MDTLTLRYSDPPDLTGIFEVADLPRFDPDAPTLRPGIVRKGGWVVVCEGQLYRACLDGTWTLVVSGFEIVGEGDSFPNGREVWSGYVALEGKHGARAEAFFLQRKFPGSVIVDETVSE